MAWISRFYHDPSTWDEEEHIRARLNDLLNSRRGFSSRIAELGLEELGDAASDDGVAPAYVRDMSVMIERWEPRVRVVSLEVQPGGSALRPILTLEVETLASGRRLHVQFGRDVAPLHGSGVEG